MVMGRFPLVLSVRSRRFTERSGTFGRFWLNLAAGYRQNGVRIEMTGRAGYRRKNTAIEEVASLLRKAVLLGLVMSGLVLGSLSLS